MNFSEHLEEESLPVWSKLVPILGKIVANYLSNRKKSIEEAKLRGTECIIRGFYHFSIYQVSKKHDHLKASYDCFQHAIKCGADKSICGYGLAITLLELGEPTSARKNVDFLLKHRQPDPQFEKLVEDLLNACRDSKPSNIQRAVDIETVEVQSLPNVRETKPLPPPKPKKSNDSRQKSKNRRHR